jgi:hypothetical protein
LLLNLFKNISKCAKRVLRFSQLSSTFMLTWMAAYNDPASPQKKNYGRKIAAMDSR